MSQTPPKQITIHCTDTPNGLRVSTDTLREAHRKRGFSDIGYHFVIQPDGLVENGRPPLIEGAHVEGHNAGNLGVCLVGRDRYTRAQWDALRKLWDGLSWQYGIRPWSVFCHHEFDSARKQGKTCPNLDPKRVLSWYLGKEDEPIWDSVLGS